MIVLDASVISAFLNTSDVNNGAASVFLSQNLDCGFAVHPLTLSEVLVGGVRLGRASELLADLADLGIGATDQIARVSRLGAFRERHAPTLLTRGAGLSG